MIGTDHGHHELRRRTTATIATATITQLDTTPPTATTSVASGQANPAFATTVHFTATFGESVTGFDATDLILGGTAPGTLSAIVTETAPGDCSTYDIAVTGYTGSGTVTVSIKAGAVLDLGGNANAASNTSTITINFTGPSVTLNQDGAQADPVTVNTNPIIFDIVFSAAVTGFTSAGVDLSSSTATGPLMATVGGGGTTYQVAVSGFTGGGTIVANVKPNAAVNAGGLGNLASTSTDNSVTYVVPAIAVQQPAGTPLTNNTSTVDFGSVTPGSSGLSKLFTILNTGGATLNVGAITKDGANYNDFTIDTTSTSATVAPAGSTTFTVTYVPGAAAPSSAAIHIASNDNNANPFTIALTGTGVDHPPTDITGTLTVPENQPIGTSAGILSATDPDVGDTFTFTLVGGTGSTDNASFSIVGNVVQTAAVFDYETKNSYSIRVRATDSGGLFFEKPLTVLITNVNEAPVVANPIPNQFANAGSAFNFTVPANTFFDVDAAADTARRIRPPCPAAQPSRPG